MGIFNKTEEPPMERGLQYGTEPISDPLPYGWFIVHDSNISPGAILYVCADHVSLVFGYNDGRGTNTTLQVSGGFNHHVSETLPEVLALIKRNTGRK